ncbi:MAG: hypothetical protein J3K34DRAFT_367999 [Monoraphidium minutum]|nr:MAG: hypothetical protein J3K34DRAFT_367999 [Monoraphidium minutum]
MSCGDFAEQRLALVYAAIMAKQTGRTLALPMMVVGGASKALDPALAANERIETAPFEELYDFPAFSSALEAAGVAAMSHREFTDAADDVIPLRLPLADAVVIDSVASFFRAHAGARHVMVDCPMFKLAPAVVKAEEKLVWAALRALKPAAALQKAVEAYRAAIGNEKYNFLHLAVEADWKRVCHRWTTFGSSDGVVRDNCFSNTHDVGRMAASMRLDKSAPLFVAANWAHADADAAAAALASLEKEGYAVVRAPDAPALAREAAALVEFEVALSAARFLGNSVRAFSALALLQRRADGRWAGHYNGGDIPLVMMMPLFRTPWVFTFNSWSPAYEPLLKAAVNSAAKQGGLAAHCVFSGDAAAPIAAWLKAKGVALHHHDPAWADRAEAAADGGGAAPAGGAPAVRASFARLDLPLVEELAQFTHVLYTDADVFFRRPFSAHEFPLPLPAAVGIGPAAVNSYPFSVGVMLANLPGLRASYDKFLDAALPKAGAKAAKLAYNMFYEAEIKSYRLPVKFNAKPYHPHAPRSITDVAIVHFHGPKPLDYLSYGNGGDCGGNGRFCAGGMAEGGRACVYIKEWMEFLEPGDRPPYDAAFGRACGGAPAAAA